MGQLDNIDIRLLRIFRKVVECGGISAAEVHLNIGRSTISRHIKDLETRLGMTLCHRGRSGFSITGEGRQVYQSACRLQTALDDFRADISEVYTHLTGNLSLALFDKIATNRESNLTGAITLFDRKAPKASLEISIEPINNIENGVINGRFHIGIIPAHRPSNTLDYEPLFGEQMYLYCGKGHPLFERAPGEVSDVDIRRHKYAGMGFHSPNMDISQQQQLHRSATVYDQEAVALLILSGCYLGFLPDHYAQSFVDQGLMRTLGRGRFEYCCRFFSITRHSPQPTRLVRAFLHCLREVHKREW